MKKFGWLVSIIILIIIISLGAQANREHELKIEQYLASPMINDIYIADLAEIKNSGYMNEKHAYGAIKLIHIIDSNSYYFAISEEAYNMKKGINKALDNNLIKYDLSDGEELLLTKEQILKLKKTGTIYNVIRTPSN